jgi:predicted RecA/RadA family phage recombinase
VANVELANEVIKYNSDTSDFTPDTFTVKNVKSVKSGKYFSVSVSTSTDANKVEVIVNGTTYELVPNNMTAVTSGTAKCYKYSKTIQAPTGTSGDTFEVSVIACKADDNTVKSDPVTMTVTIK